MMDKTINLTRGEIIDAASKVLADYGALASVGHVRVVADLATRLLGMGTDENERKIVTIVLGYEYVPLPWSPSATDFSFDDDEPVSA